MPTQLNRAHNHSLSHALRKTIILNWSIMVLARSSLLDLLLTPWVIKFNLYLTFALSQTILSRGIGTLVISHDIHIHAKSCALVVLVSKSNLLDHF